MKKKTKTKTKTKKSKIKNQKQTSPSLHGLAELQRRHFLTPNIAVCLQSSLCSPSAPASPPSSPFLPPADPPAPRSLLPFLPLPSPSAVAFSSFTAITANLTAFLLRDAVAGSSANFAAAPVSLSLFILAAADDMRVLKALTLLRRRRLRLCLHQPAGPCSPTRRRSNRPRPLPSPLFPSRRRRGPATGAFVPCFLTASPPPSPLHPRPASSAASFSFDAVLCCRYGLEVAVSLDWSLLRVRTLPPSPLPSLPSTLLSWTPVARCLLSPPSPPLPLVSATAAVEKTASTSFAVAFLSDLGIDLFRLWYADFVRLSNSYAYIMIFLL